MTETAVTPDFPVLNLAERDRRWQAARRLCETHDLEALVVFGTGRDQLDHYLANEAQKGIVFLPREGEPVYLVRSGNYPYARYDEPGRDFERWIDEVRPGSPLTNITNVVGERDLKRARVGIVGLTSTSVGEGMGTIPYTLWTQVVRALPDVVWVDVAKDFERLTLVKGAEEIPMLRKAAQLGEAMTTAFWNATRVGARESEVAAAAMAALIAGGGWTLPPYMLLRSGSEALGWVRPEWIGMGGGSRVLERGDVIGAELFACYAGYESQQQVVVSLGEPDATHGFLGDVARASYDAGLAALRPGATFAQLCDAMHAPLKDNGCWSMGPLVQTVSPVMFNSAMYVDADGPTGPGSWHQPEMPRDGDLVIEAGMAFAFEPNALRGSQRVCIGGTILVTDDGYEELNSLPNRLLVADAA